MAYEGYQMLAVVWLLGAVLFTAMGFANLRGKGLDQKATARVRAEDMPAWRRIQAVVHFLLAVVLLVASVSEFYFGGQAAQNPVAGRIFTCLIGVCVLELGLLAYSYWRYAPKH